MADSDKPSPPDWLRAISFAARAHRHQLRKDRKTPYIAHTMRVMMIARDLFGCDDPVALAAAALHDTIEDTPTDFDDIERRFGTETALCVRALTKNMLLREDEREPTYDRRLDEGPWQARLVKLADVYDNLADSVSNERTRRKTPRCIERAERAIAIAESDPDPPACIARAIEIVRELVDSST